MASIPQQPGEWNLAYVPNVWTVQSTNTETAAISVEINGVEVATVRNNHNQANVAHFDVSKILQSYLEPKFFETTEKVTDLEALSLKYRVRYGDVLDSGAIDWTAYSATKYVTNGYDDWRIIDWDESPYRANITITEPCEVGTGSSVRVDEKDYLTNYPGNIPVESNDYHTLSFFNWIGNQTAEVWSEQPWFVEYLFTTTGGTQTASYVISDLEGLGPRTDASDLGPYIFDPSEYIGHVGAGPQNLIDAGMWPSGVTSYQVNIYNLDKCYYDENGVPSSTNNTAPSTWGAATPTFSTAIGTWSAINGGSISPWYGDLMYSKTFEIVENCGKFDSIRVSFLNQYGVKDYFSFSKRNTYTVEDRRKNYKQSLGTWNDATFSVDPMGRGLRTFASSLQERMTMETDWLTDAESIYLEELFTSSHINIYYQGVWTPAVITSRIYDERTIAREKLFRYTLEIEYANQQKRQRG